MDGSTIQVNFGKPMPLFPLPNVVMLPHGIQHLHIFERRYRQMVQHTLDQSGQFAIATMAGEEPECDLDDDSPELRSAVCVIQVMQHHRFPDGRYNLLVLGICRAQIAHIDEPEGDRLYRLARLRLLERPEMVEADLSDERAQLQHLLNSPRLQTLRGVNKVRQLAQRDDVPTNALLELIGSSLLEDNEVRYALLAEPMPQRRAAIIERELRSMDAVIRAAQWQMNAGWPKGMSWN
jgi:Lon protease-like protein